MRDVFSVTVCSNLQSKDLNLGIVALLCRGGRGGYFRGQRWLKFRAHGSKEKATMFSGEKNYVTLSLILLSPWSNPKLGDMGNNLQRLGFCTSCTELEEEFGVKICTVEQSWDSLEFHVGQQEIQVLGEQGTEIMDNVKTQDPHLKALIRPR